MRGKNGVTYLWIVVIVAVLSRSGVESACTYTTKPNTEGDQADYQKFKSGVSSGAECQTWCDTTVGDDNNPCVAVDFKGGVCFMFTGPTTLFDNAQCTHYEKSCTPDPCTMSTRMSNTVASSSSMVAVPMTSVADCSATCKHLGDCEAVIYSNGACKIFSDVASTSQLDSVDYIKITCSNGKQCCMVTATDQKAAAAAILTLDQTIDSCETACLNYDNCQAVHHRNNVCFFHLATPTTSANTDSTYSSKYCASGAIDGTQTIVTSCPDTGSHLKAAGVVFALVYLSRMLLLD